MKPNLLILALLASLLLVASSLAQATVLLPSNQLKQEALQQLLRRHSGGRARHGGARGRGRRRGFKCDPFYLYLFGICGRWPFPTYPSPGNPFQPPPATLPSPRPNSPPPLLPSPPLPPLVPSPPPPSPPLVPSPPPPSSSPPPPLVPSPPPPLVFPPSLIIPPPLVFSPPPFPDIPETPMLPDIFTNPPPPDFPSGGFTQAPPLVPEHLPPAPESIIPVQPWRPPSDSPPFKN